jgi:hypothetical protein
LTRLSPVLCGHLILLHSSAICRAWEVVNTTTESINFKITSGIYLFNQIALWALLHAKIFAFGLGGQVKGYGFDYQ